LHFLKLFLLNLLLIINLIIIKYFLMIYFQLHILNILVNYINIVKLTLILIHLFQEKLYLIIKMQKLNMNQIIAMWHILFYTFFSTIKKKLINFKNLFIKQFYLVIIVELGPKHCWYKIILKFLDKLYYLFFHINVLFSFVNFYL